MLILRFVEKRAKEKRKRFFYRKRLNNNDTLNRYSIIVKGKSVSVLELNEAVLNNENVQMLLKMYKGRILVSESYKNYDELKDYLFNPKLYYQRALLSSLLNQIRRVNKEWENICVKTSEFFPFKELYKLVKITKKVTIIGESNCYTDKFLKDCYYQYGAIVYVRNDNLDWENCVFVDLDSVDNCRKLTINAYSKSFTLFSDIRYFEESEEYQKLAPFDLYYDEICAAFSGK